MARALRKIDLATYSLNWLGNSIKFLGCDKKQAAVLEQEVDIIVGIACGLLYLHKDSRLRIIHRDLKPSNIRSRTLESQGFSRGNRQEITKRVFGTYGYIAPEYALKGHISVKSDVFSFGVLVLEIVSEKKIMGFSRPDNNLNLLGYAWKLWTEGNPLKLVDEAIEEPFPSKEVVRCIQTGLLCAQLQAEDMPLKNFLDIRKLGSQLSQGKGQNSAFSSF